MTFPVGYFYKTKFDFYEIMGWEFDTMPAAALLDYAWAEYKTEHPEEAEQYRHRWQGTFELEGSDIVVYLEEEYDAGNTVGRTA